MLGIGGDAGAHREHHFLIGEAQRLVECTAQALRHEACFFVVAQAHGDDGEFVRAQTRQVEAPFGTVLVHALLDGLDLIAQAFGGRTQRRVPDRQAEVVVDALEAIDVQIEQGNVLLSALPYPGFERIHEVIPVG